MRKLPPSLSSGGNGYPLRSSLRTKTFIWVGVASSALILIYLLFIDFTLKSSFQQLQEQLSTQRVERMILQLAQMVKMRVAYAKDNSEWDETYEFFTGNYPNFLRNNYNSDKEISGVQLIVAYDQSRKVIDQHITGKPDEIMFETIDLSSLGTEEILSDEGVSGFIASDGNVFLVNTHPVNRSENKEKSPGWLAFFVPIDETKIQVFSELAGMPVRVVESENISDSFPDERIIFIETTQFGVVRAKVPKEIGDFLEAGATPRVKIFFPSLADATKSVMFDVGVPARIFATAAHIQRRIWAFAVVGAAVFLIMCLLAFEALVVRRIITLDSDLQEVAESCDQNQRVRVIGNDEIARVADTANRMLESLAVEHAKTEKEHDLLESVLHSVGEGVMALRPMVGNSGEIEDFEVISANSAAERYCHSGQVGLVGRKLSELGDFKTDPSVTADYILVIETKRQVIREFLYTCLDSEKWIRHSVTIWGDGVVVCFEDITTRKQSEQAHAESLDELTRLTAAMMGREERVLELKNEVNLLCEKLDSPPKYGTSEVFS